MHISYSLHKLRIPDRMYFSHDNWTRGFHWIKMAARQRNIFLTLIFV
jgi:hypothetical protein